MKQLLSVVKIPLVAFAFFIMGWCSYAIVSSAAYGGTQSQSVSTTPTTLDAAKIESFANSERTNRNLAPLRHSAALKQSACLKLEYMVAHNYWEHDAPDGTKPWKFIYDVGYTFTSAGENQAYGQMSEHKVVSDWMDSTGHRDNLLGNYQEMGVCTKLAKFQGGEYHVTVQHLATPQ